MKNTRFDPLTETEWTKLRNAPDTMRWKQGEPVPTSYKVILETLYQLGCHPSVLSRKDGLRFYQHEGVWLAEWRRPKTKKLCCMDVPDALLGPLRAYLERPYDRRHIWRIVSQSAKHAGLEGVGPRTLRHTKGMRVFREDGPGAVREALGISERLVADYTTRTARQLAVERGKRQTVSSTQ